MTGKAIVVQGNALALQLPDESVDLVITSPPYFALRSYRDGGEHYEGQIGSEPTPQDFLEALWAATAEMKRVLKPSGSIWVNLGDKYAGSGEHNNAGLAKPHTGSITFASQAKNAESRPAERRNAPGRYNQNSGGIQAKSLMGLPWRYAIGCIDQLGLILRAEVIWSKPNGLPESVTDRVRRSHEQWFHFTKQGKYFAAVDEVREALKYPDDNRQDRGPRIRYDGIISTGNSTNSNPLGKLPGSVWTIPSEPLRIPDDVKEAKNLPDHFAAFPSAWPVRIISGWSPTGICTACDESRRPVVEKKLVGVWHDKADDDSKFLGERAAHQHNLYGVKETFGSTEATITGYTCGCGCVWGPDDVQPSTRQAVVLDPFGGTGTVAMVAKQLGRVGISVDLSADYCRLAEWRCNESDHGPKAIAKARKKGLLRSETAPPKAPVVALPDWTQTTLDVEGEAA